MAELTCDDDVAAEVVEAAAAADRATVAIRHGLRRTQHQIQVSAACLGLHSGILQWTLWG